MSLLKRSCLLGAAALAALTLSACSNESGDEHAGMDHSGMDHSEMNHEGMDHGSMDHSGHEGMEMASASTPSYGAAEHVAEFTLMGSDGEMHSLSDHADAPAVVLMTHGVGCPIVRNAVTDYKNLAAQFEGEGIPFYMINSNIQDDLDELAADAELYSITMPILDDEDQSVGRQMGYDRTAQIYVLDPSDDFRVMYYGSLNDRQTYERQRNEANNHYAADVLNQMLAGEEVTVTAPAIRAGCMINFL